MRSQLNYALVHRTDIKIVFLRQCFVSKIIASSYTKPFSGATGFVFLCALDCNSHDQVESSKDSLEFESSRFIPASELSTVGCI